MKNLYQWRQSTSEVGTHFSSKMYRNGVSGQRWLRLRIKSILWALREYTSVNHVKVNVTVLQGNKLEIIIFISGQLRGASIQTSDAQSQRRRGGGWNFLFPLSAYQKAPYPSLRLYIVLQWWFVCVSFNNRHRIACLLSSLTTDHYHFVLILRVTATVDLSDD